MNEKDYKKKHKPASCSLPPWYNYVTGPNKERTMRKIREESVDHYGRSLDRCSRIDSCETACIGRILPWKSPTAIPYLIQLAKDQGINPGEEMYVSGCNGCPIAPSCTSTCKQVNNFLERHDTKEPTIYYKDALENYDTNVTMPMLDSGSGMDVNGDDIPWDVLPERKRSVVKEYLYNNKEFRVVANQLNLNDQSRARYEFYSALNKLSEYAIMRKFIEAHKKELTIKQLNVLNYVYFQNKSITETASILNISKQAAQQIISRVVKKHKITWETFVKKKVGNRVIYTIPSKLIK